MVFVVVDLPVDRRPGPNRSGFHELKEIFVRIVFRWRNGRVALAVFSLRGEEASGQSSRFARFQGGCGGGDGGGGPL